jgi:hypothetical protein
MAGFAIDMGDEGAAYSRGVNMPSYSGTEAAISGLTSIGQGVFKTLDSMDRAKRAAAPTETQKNKAAFGALSTGVDELQGLAPLQQRSKLMSLISTYTNAGNEIGESEARMIKLKTGIDVDYINMNPQQAALNSAVEKISANTGYLYNARKVLEAGGKPYTDNDVLALAISDVQRTEAAALYLVNAKNIERQEFLTTYVPQANLAIEKIRGLALTGIDIEQQGGNITPDNIVKLRTDFDIVKAQLTKPPLIEQGDWQVVQSQIDTLDKLITSLETYDERTLSAMKADIINANSEVLIKLARDKIDDPIISSALLSDKFDPTNYVAENYDVYRKALQNLTAEDVKYTDLDNFSLGEGQDNEPNQGGDNVVSSVSEDLHSIEEVEKAEDRSNTARKDSIFFAVTQRIKNVTLESLNQPEFRENFFAGVGQATVNIATSPQLFKTETMSQIYNDDTYKRLDLAKTLDPEKAEVAKNRLIDGLQSQANMAFTQISGQAKSSFFKLTGLGEIEYDLERRVDTGQIRMDRKALPLVKGFASKHYNGNVTQMIADRARRLSTFERSQVENVGFKFNVAFQDYRKMAKNSNSLKFYIDNMKKLGVPTDQIESTLIRPINADPSLSLGTFESPWQIVWSDETDVDDKLFASIGKGQYYTDINGDVRIKD